jgi:hypothetical protein
MTYKMIRARNCFSKEKINYGITDITNSFTVMDRIFLPYRRACCALWMEQLSKVYSLL